MKKQILLLTLLLGAGFQLLANGGPSDAPTSVSFRDFLNQFPSGNLPYTFGEQELRSTLEARTQDGFTRQKPNKLSWEFYNFLPDLEDIASYSNMPVYPEPVVAFETSEYHIVVYNTGRAFAKQFKTYNVALFDKNGVHLATYCIAGVRPEALMSATLDENLNLTIKEYEVLWEKDLLETGLIGNQVTDLKLIQTRQLALAQPDTGYLSPYRLPGMEDAHTLLGCK